MALDTDRVPAGTRQGSQGSATGYGTCGTPKSTICPPSFAAIPVIPSETNSIPL